VAVKVAVACGGTGGHVFPGVATARELLSRGHEVTLWMTGRETELSARKDWDGPVVEVPAKGFPSGISLQALLTGLRLAQAVWRCCAEMRKDRPDVLLAMGSYASVGPCAAAKRLGVPIVLHEANVIPGKAVRLFAPGSAAVAAGFEETRYHLHRARVSVVGIPLREELTEEARGLPPRESAVHAPLRLLVVGGSMGAHRLNEVVAETLIRLKKNGLEFSVSHLTGKEDEAVVRSVYAAAGVTAEVIAFTKYMAPLYHAADLAICRAGASTCAELAYFGLPALFVPYPRAAGDHQAANARALEKRGTADVVDESALTPEWLEAYLAQTAAQTGAFGATARGSAPRRRAKRHGRPGRAGGGVRAPAVNQERDSAWRAEIRRWLRMPATRVHLMGVGGIGMAGVARLLAAKGLVVTGCDGGAPRTMEWLRACNIPATTGHDSTHLENVDWAIYSPALQPGHPERMAAEARGIPLYRRGQVLPVLAEQWKTIAVSGTHGKTTTSAMIAHILRHCGADPSWCIGGELPPAGAPAGVGASAWLVIEADESDGTLAHYAPEIAVITNVEFDHMEHFASRSAMADCFEAFARQARTVVFCADDPEAARIGAASGGVSYGFSPGAQFRAEILEAGPGGSRFSVEAAAGWTAVVQLSLTGRHNVLNALGALAACMHCGTVPADACAALRSFALPRRRFERVAEARGIRVVADYAHHPTEIRAVIDAARQAGAGRIWAVFQPHRYTRTLALGADFPPAFDGVAGVILLPVYAASEPSLAGGASEDLLKQFWRHAGAPAELAKDLEQAAEGVAARWKSGDWVLVVGAGDVEDLGPMLKERLLRLG
jgi:UDP-N-acetylmuramate--alanine ligase